MREKVIMNGKIAILLTIVLWLAPGMLAQASGSAGTCSAGSDDPATKAAIDSAAMQVFQQAQTGNYAGLRANAIAGLASSFGGVENAIGENQANFKGASATVRSEFILDASGGSGQGRTNFFCGVFNSPDAVGFGIDGLPPGKYAIAIMDVKGGKDPITLSTILQYAGGWKLAGFYARPTQLAGHDGNWFLQQARAYKAKGQAHNAYFYFLEGWELLAPLNFMSTKQLDGIADELQGVRPADIPSPSQPVPITANGKTYNMTQMFATPVGNAIDLVVKFQVPSIADQNAAYNDTAAVIKALVGKYPELRDAFGGVVARAVEPSGNDYGTLLAMKDVK